MATSGGAAAARLVHSIVRAAPRELPQVARIIVAATVTWLIADWLGAPEPPVYAVLVPLLVMREDPFAALNGSVGRLVGVVAGVLIGVAVLDLLPEGIGAGIAMLTIALLVGMVLRVGDVLNVQVAVSAFIVFTVGSPAGGFAWRRLWETGVGVVVSVLLAPLLFPPNPVRLIERRLDRFGEDLHDVMISAAGAPGAGDEGGTLVETVRQLRRDDEQAQRSARWNPLQRRLLPALRAQHERIELADALAIHVHAFSADLLDLARRGYGDVLAARRAALLTVATPLAAAVRSAVDGRDDAGDLPRAEAALAADRAADQRPVAVVTRHPLMRVQQLLS